MKVGKNFHLWIVRYWRIWNRNEITNFEVNEKCTDLDGSVGRSGEEASPVISQSHAADVHAIVQRGKLEKQNLPL